MLLIYSIMIWNEGKVKLSLKHYVMKTYEGVDV
jgi:hypothetical protein